MLSSALMTAALLLSAPTATLAASGAADEDPAPAEPTLYCVETSEEDLAQRPYTIELALAEAELAAKRQDHEAALKHATLAWAHATSDRPLADQPNLLARAVALRARALLALGRTEAARAALVDILIGESSGGVWVYLAGGRTSVKLSGQESAGVVVVPAGPAAMSLRRQVANDIRVIRVRQDIEAMLDPGVTAPRDEDVEAYVARVFGTRTAAMDDDVLASLLAGDPGLILSLGARAAPSLAAFTLYGASMYEVDGEWRLDPLAPLIAVDLLGAARLIADHQATGGTPFRLRALEALRREQALASLEWRLTADGRMVATEPEALVALAALLHDPEVVRRANPELELLAKNDGVSPAIAEALNRAIDAGGGPIADRVLRSLSLAGRASVVPVLERAIQVSLGPARLLGAEALAELDRSDVLRSLHGDPDPGVRRLVARSLRRMTLTNGSPTQEDFRTRAPSIDAAARDVLRRLAGDPDPTVRHEALLAILDLDEPFEPAFFQAFLATASRDDQAELAARFDHPDRAATRDVLRALAMNGDAQVRGAIDKRLVKGNRIHEDLAVTGPAYEARLFLTTPRLRLPETLAVFGFGRSDEGVTLLLDWGLRHDSPATLVQALIGVDSFDQRDALARRSTDELAQVLRATWDESPYRLADQLVPFPEVARALFLRFVADDREPRQRRIFATGRALKAWSPDVEDAVLTFLSSPTWTAAPPTAAELGALRSLVGGEESVRSAFLVRLTEHPEVPDAVCAAVLRGAARDAVAPALARAIVARFLAEVPAEPIDEEVQIAALNQAAALPRDQVGPEVFLNALQSPSASLAGVALAAMERRRDPEFLEPLAAVLRGGGLRCATSSYNLEQLQIVAARALSGYRDPRVVPALLDGLRVSERQAAGKDDHLARTIEDALEVQRLRADAAAGRYARIAVDRESSLARLVTQLGDEDVTIRRYAASALATLGSAEALPYLIDALKDPAEPVRQAARSAIQDIESAKRMEAWNSKDG